jgi:hypothetical protein
MNESIPRDQLSGTPTSARPAATPFKVAMTVALLIALQPFVSIWNPCQRRRSLVVKSCQPNRGLNSIMLVLLMELFEPWPAGGGQQ